MLTLTDSQQCPLEVSFQDKKGNPATVDGTPSWSVSDETILEIVPDTDGMTATVKAIGPLGNAQVVVKADADKTAEGQREIVGILEVTVVAGEAVATIVAAGAPSEQP